MERKSKKQGDPVDPDELARRLETYLTQSKMWAEDRRQKAQLRAKRASAQNDEKKRQGGSRPISTDNAYRHVPREAASAFARTATSEPMRNVHGLSQPAVKQHLEQIRVSNPGASKMQVINHAMNQQQMLRQRNQFQQTRAMEDADEIDEVRGVYKSQSKSFMDHISGNRNASRPLSTGDGLYEDRDALLAKARRKSRTMALDMSGRGNWTQDDEVSDSKKDAVVKRKPSSWILLGRKSPKPEKDEAVSGVGGSASPPDLKHQKSSFLARFKHRHAV